MILMSMLVCVLLITALSLLIMYQYKAKMCRQHMRVLYLYRTTIITLDCENRYHRRVYDEQQALLAHRDRLLVSRLAELGAVRADRDYFSRVCADLLRASAGLEAFSVIDELPDDSHLWTKN